MLQLRKQTLSQNNDKHPGNSFKQQRIRRASTVVSHKGIMQTAPGKSRRRRSRDLQGESAHQLKRDCWSNVLGNTRLSKGTIRANCSFRSLHRPRGRAQKKRLKNPKKNSRKKEHTKPVRRQEERLEDQDVCVFNNSARRARKSRGTQVREGAEEGEDQSGKAAKRGRRGFKAVYRNKVLPPRE